MATLKTLIALDLANGSQPYGSLIADAAGNLFGTTAGGGATFDGTVFELVRTATGYAETLTTLVNFDASSGSFPAGTLIIDAAGNLFGMTRLGGGSGEGTVFEVAKTATGYASTATTLLNLSNAPGQLPYAGVVADAAGNLFGTLTSGGTHGQGAVFELAKAEFGFAFTSTIVASFNGANGDTPWGSVIIDSAGNLFGTTQSGGANQHGTVFEIAKTRTGYNHTPIVLASFNGADGSWPVASLVLDAAGNLFGTTIFGGASDDGEVFEIVKTQSGYASTPTVLASFDWSNGGEPFGSLILDAAGNLFGTTTAGGANGYGTAFEIAKTPTGYSETPITLFDFNGANGSTPYAGLLADAAGNLFGANNQGGPNGWSDVYGTLFELTDTGFQVACYLRGTRIATPRGEIEIEHLAIGDAVLTADGKAAPIRWIGRRAYGGRFLAGRRELLPVHIRAGALGGGLPWRDLFVSPLHAMFLDGMLVPAIELVNGVSIVQLEAVDTVEYFHIELACHDVILAEGAPSESFIDDDSRMMFHNAHEYAALYPDARRSPALYCAPRITEGFALDAIRHTIARHAGLEEVRPAQPLRGYLDRVDADVVEGWAQDPSRPDVPVCLDVLVDGVVVAQTLANRYRADLAAASIGNGCHSFSVRPPVLLTLRAQAQTEVRRASDRLALKRTWAAFAAARGDRRAVHASDAWG